MKKSQIALQTYTLRDYCQTEADFAASMAKTAAMGYPAVEISGTGPLSPSRMRTLCHDQGLTICSLHETGETLLKSPQALVEKLERLGARHAVYPFPHLPLKSLKAVRRLAEQLEKAGEILAGAGKQLSYHNHNHEFYALEDGRLILEVLLAETNPRHLQFELDCYWVQAGGGSPQDWIRRLQGRLPLLHLKDACIRWEGENPEMCFAPVGEGRFDWPALCGEAHRGGTEWFIVEQDAFWPQNDPFLAARRSFQFLQDNIL